MTTKKITAPLDYCYAISFEIDFPYMTWFRWLSVYKCDIVNETWKNYIIKDRYEVKIEKSKILKRLNFCYFDFHEYIHKVNHYNDHVWFDERAVASSRFFYTFDKDILNTFVEAYYNSLQRLQEHLNAEFSKENDSMQLVSEL